MIILSKKKNIKMIAPVYDYYSTVKEKSDKIAENTFKINDEIFKARLYNLILNMCNQFVYDYTYVFSKQDLYFIADYNINIHKLLDEFKMDILQMKKINNKNNR